MRIAKIRFLSDISDLNPEHDNIDVHVTLEDGREFTFIVATPNNIFWCMENEGIDYFFAEPIIFLAGLTHSNVGRGLQHVVSDDDGRWLLVYGTPSGSSESEET